VIQNPANPQCFNRYSYCVNNPLKYIDPTGHFWDWFIDWASIAFDAIEFWNNPSWANGGYLLGDLILGIVPFIPAGIGPLVKGVTKGTEIVKGVDKVIEGAKIAGEWVKANESMSDFARAYQKYITGTDKIFLRNSIKFDGLIGNILVEAKGTYANFVDKSGKFYEWFSGKDELVNQALRQLKAADGVSINWYIAD
jgi:hypothetical protein